MTNVGALFLSDTVIGARASGDAVRVSVSVARIGFVSMAIVRLCCYEST